jgi:hypothetical protein
MSVRVCKPAAAFFLVVASHPSVACILCATERRARVADANVWSSCRLRTRDVEEHTFSLFDRSRGSAAGALAAGA